MTPTPLTAAQVAETIGNINGFMAQLNNMKPQLPRPNTYIKIRDIEQLKLLCEYKNDEVRFWEDKTISGEIDKFNNGWDIFIWEVRGDGFTLPYIPDLYTELTDDSFLYPKPMKEKKQKQEIIFTKYHIGETVFVYRDNFIKKDIINSISLLPSFQDTELHISYKIGEGQYREEELFKTKSQLIKFLSKQWR